METIFRMLYQPPAYEPGSFADRAHSWPRLTGDNQFPLDFDDTDQVGEYVIGAVLFPALMFGGFLIWVCSLCCMRKGCCGCSSLQRTFLFATFGGVSALAWFISFSGEATVSGGTGSLVESLRKVQTLSLDIENLANAAANIASDVSASVDAAVVDCTFPSPAPDFSDFANDIKGIVGPELDESLDAFSKPLRDIRTQIDKIIDPVEEARSLQSTGYFFFVICMIAITMTWVGFNTLRLLPEEKVPDCLEKVADIGGVVTNGCVFYLGIIFLLGLWLAVIGLSVLALPAADLCVPDVDVTIRNILATTKSNSTYTFDSETICEEQEFEILCYYQRCIGTSPLAEYKTEVDNVNVSAITELYDYVDALYANVPVAQHPAVDVCKLVIDDIVDTVETIPDALSSLLGLAECSSINPIYLLAVHDGLCNGIVDGLLRVIIWWIVGAIFLMAAMSVYKTINFDETDYGDEIKTAMVVSDQQAKYA